MTISLITFSDESMSRSQEECEMSALRNGATSFTHWSQDELKETDWYRANESLLSQPRGCGFWAWKAWVILAELEIGAQFNDVVIYSDVGIEFINNVHYIIDRMDQDIFLFGNNWQHVHWCKADVIKAITPDWFECGLPVFNKQVQASVIFFRVSDYSRKFVKEWLDWCLFEGGRLIDDSPSRTPNHPEFREHRHDQAILTTMAYRDGLKLHYWPAMYNDGAFTYEKLPEYAEDDYPVLFHHHRRRNHEWEAVATYV